MKIAARIATAVVLALAALIAVPASAQPAKSRATDDPASVLVGRWVGSYSGFVDGRYVSGGEKIVITKAKGYAAKGTWQYKGSSGHWSKPAPVQFVVTIDADGVVGVRGADGEGTYDGELVSANRLVFAYLDPQPELTALRFSVTRR